MRVAGIGEIVASTFAFEKDPAVVARCRDFVVKILRTRPDIIVDRAALLTSELVSNVLLHTSSGGTLSVRVAEESVRLEVKDKSPELPVTLPHGVDDTRGRGLPIVEALADEWGVALEDSGKTVWATIDFDA
jgi:anti-sigma regulatory factor (Ser/Thr protein kinase)